MDAHRVVLVCADLIGGGLHVLVSAGPSLLLTQFWSLQLFSSPKMTKKREWVVSFACPYDSASSESRN